MLLQKNNQYFDVVQVSDVIDYIENGTVYTNVPMQSVMVESSSDLLNLINYKPGTIAFTAGFNDIWQKAADGTWTEFVRSGE